MTQIGFNLLGHPNINKDGGFNYKDLYTQIDKISELFDEINKRGYDASELIMRIRGGNSSMRFGFDLWNDELLNKWKFLQEKYCFKIIYGLNYNESLNDELSLFMHFGKYLQINTLEMGNECYLPKFQKSHTLDKTGVVTISTEFMTIDKYMDMSESRINYFKGFNLPFYIQFAPKGKLKGSYYKKWNDVIFKYMKDNPEFDLHGTLHCYANDGNFPYDLITEIKEKMPKGRNLFITEYGAKADEGDKESNSDSLDVAFMANQDAKHTNELKKRLDVNDALLSHQLFNNYTSDGRFDCWINSDGITVKGQAMLNELFQK